MIPHHLSDTVKHWIDALSLGALVASILEWVPETTALLVLAWTVMRMVESYQAIKLNRRRLRDK